VPINKYKCTECDFSDEYIESFSTSKENWHPEACPECGKGKLEKVFDMENSHGGFDIIGSCYMNDYGKHAWKKRMSAEDAVKVLKDNKDPY
jgi:putative FmdB family regulatory protein